MKLWRVECLSNIVKPALFQWEFVGVFSTLKKAQEVVQSFVIESQSDELLWEQSEEGDGTLFMFSECHCVLGESTIKIWFICENHLDETDSMFRITQANLP